MDLFIYVIVAGGWLGITYLIRRSRAQARIGSDEQLAQQRHHHLAMLLPDLKSLSAWSPNQWVHIRGQMSPLSESHESLFSQTLSVYSMAIVHQHLAEESRSSRGGLSKRWQEISKSVQTSTCLIEDGDQHCLIDLTFFDHSLLKPHTVTPKLDLDTLPWTDGADNIRFEERRLAIDDQVYCFGLLVEDPHSQHMKLCGTPDVPLIISSTPISKES